LNLDYYDGYYHYKLCSCVNDIIYEKESIEDDVSILESELKASKEEN